MNPLVLLTNSYNWGSCSEQNIVRGNFERHLFNSLNRYFPEAKYFWTAPGAAPNSKWCIEFEYKLHRMTLGALRLIEKNGSNLDIQNTLETAIQGKIDKLAAIEVTSVRKGACT